MSENKDRHISILKFFEVLQREYYIAEIRKKIYPSPKDKKYYKKVMDFKKQKIEDIALKNNLDSIFNNDEEKRNYILQIYPVIGLPKFELTNDDIINYYNEGAEVRVNIEEKKLTGHIVRATLEKNLVFVKLKGESIEKPFNFQVVTRIL